MYFFNLNTRRKLGRAMVRLGCSFRFFRYYYFYLFYFLERLEVIFFSWRNFFGRGVERVFRTCFSVFFFKGLLV